VALQRVSDRRVGETAEDIGEWLGKLEGCPPISRFAVLSCPNPMHADEPATWFYVEADSRGGVARRRCLGCADVRYTLDSEQAWTNPSMWSCNGCEQLIAELAVGVHEEADEDGSPVVTWLAMAGRCVSCGTLAGITDVTINRRPFAEILPTL
jgi:hypothetical protein